MPTYEAQVDTFFYRYLLPDGPVKGADGTIPAGTQFDFSKIITQNNKEYGVIEGDLPLPGWNVTGRYDYCVLYNDVQAAGTEPPPEGELITIPVGEASIVVKSGLLAGTYDSVIETLWRKRAG